MGVALEHEDDEEVASQNHWHLNYAVQITKKDKFKI